MKLLGGRLIMLSSKTNVYNELIPKEDESDFEIYQHPQVTTSYEEINYDEYIDNLNDWD